MPDDAGLVMVEAQLVADDMTCPLHRVHNPSVSTLLRHIVYPTDLQYRVFSKQAHYDPLSDEQHDLFMASQHREFVMVCPTGKFNVDAYINYLLGEGKPLAVRVGPETKNLAARGVRLYQAALAAL